MMEKHQSSKGAEDILQPSDIAKCDRREPFCKLEIMVGKNSIRNSNKWSLFGHYYMKKTRSERKMLCFSPHNIWPGSHNIPSNEVCNYY